MDAGWVRRGVAFLSALAFVGGIAALVLLAEPPGVVAAIIAVVAVGVLLEAFVPSSVWARARWPRVTNRSVAHRPPGATTHPIADQES
jgi:hypothetical protein